MDVASSVRSCIEGLSCLSGRMKRTEINTYYIDSMSVFLGKKANKEEKERKNDQNRPKGV